MQSIGGSVEDSVDPVLANRTARYNTVSCALALLIIAKCRFNKYNEAVEKLANSMKHYMDASQAQINATVGLMQAFSNFFAVQLQDCTCLFIRVNGR